MTRKYHRGRFLATEQEWVWGAFDRDSGRVIIRRFNAAQRNRINLLTLMAANVDEGSIIYTDGWYRHPETSNAIIDLGMTSHH